MSKLLKSCCSVGFIVRVVNLAGGGTALFAMMIVITADVVGRFVGKPFLGAVELSQFIMIVVVFLGLASVQRQGGHISVKLFTQRLPARLQTRIDIFLIFLALVFFLLMTWRIAEVVYEAYHQQKSWWNLPFPLWIVYLCASFGCFVMVLELLDELVHQVKRNTLKNEPGIDRKDERLS